MRPWSFSRLSTRESCGKQYWYYYIDHTPSARPDSPAANRGKTIHDLAEQYLKGEITMYPPELQKVAAHAMLLKSKGAKPEVKYAVLPDWTPCEYDNPEAYFRGILDVVYNEGEIVHVQDWKTGQVYDDHPEQLAQYSMLVASYNTEAKAIHTRLIYIDQGIVTKPKITPMEHIKGARIMFDGRIQNAESDTVYTESPGQHCRWCDWAAKYGGPCKYG